MIRRAGFLAPVVSVPICALVGVALSGCGYTLVRDGDVRRDAGLQHRFVTDSVQLIALQRQIAALQAQCRADSVRFAALRLSASAAADSALKVADSTLKARDTEIATLRDQLAQANVELDRIKRRLANPRP